VTGRQFSALFQESIKNILENVGVTFAVRIRQGAPGNAGQSEMIPFTVLALEAYLNIPKTRETLCLSKQQHQQLLPAGKPLGVPVAVVTIYAFLETVLTNELH